MRKLIFSILLASAAASPALAQDHGRWHNDSEQSDRAEARAQAHEQRQEAREQRSQAPQQQAQPDRAPRFEMRQQQQQPQQQQAGDQGRGGWDRSHFGGQANGGQQQAVEQQQQQQRQFERRDRGSWNGGDRRGNFSGQVEQVQRNQQDGSWARARGSWSRDRDGDFRQRQAEQQSRSGTWSGSNWSHNNTRWSGNWNRDWRNDRRYDWRRYRDSHRSIFRIGVYFDPFGYGYRRFDIGYRLQPYYYEQRYWIDPGLYQLPYPPPGTMWVRYWNDALLVDMYSGEVVDVIRDFFW
jgi:hypothetical protein